MIHEANPVLTNEERVALNDGKWFSSLSPMLRHDILRRARVKRFLGGEQLAARGDRATEWVACAKGAIRISSSSAAGKAVTLAYIEPGIWFGDVSIFDGDRRTHDAFAHGETTILCVPRERLRDILAQHVELYEALLRLQSRRIRKLFETLENLQSLRLRDRVLMQIQALGRSHGAPLGAGERTVQIGLRMAQEDLARMVGASRQRVNQVLKAIERECLIQQGAEGLIICDTDLLSRSIDGAGATWQKQAALQARAAWMPGG